MGSEEIWKSFKKRYTEQILNEDGVSDSIKQMFDKQQSVKDKNVPIFAIWWRFDKYEDGKIENEPNYTYVKKELKDFLKTEKPKNLMITGKRKPGYKQNGLKLLSEVLTEVKNGKLFHFCFVYHFHYLSIFLKSMTL